MDFSNQGYIGLIIALCNCKNKIKNLKINHIKKLKNKNN